VLSSVAAAWGAPVRAEMDAAAAAAAAAKRKARDRAPTSRPGEREAVAARATAKRGTTAP
jgi:hypothetical protein